MGHDVKLGQREAALILSKRSWVRMSEIGEVISAGFGEVYGHLAAHGVEPMGPPFVIYHGKPDPQVPFDLEICAPVSRAVDPPHGWRFQELPAGSFVTLVHVGPYDTLGSAYDTILAWIGANGLLVAGPPREVYVSEPDTPPEQIHTIIEFPVALAGVPVG